SYLPWFEVFYKFLNTLADYITKGQIDDMKVMLAALYKQPIPLAPGSITLQMAPYFIAPDPRGLPSIPENRNLTELVVAVDVTNLLQLYASMLFERRILIFARKLNTLTSCLHALGALLYPMHWQHIFIPVLPPHLLDYCCAPMPYLIGVHSSLAEKVRSRGLEEVVILNVDTNTLETPFNDLKKIPSDVSGLKVCLKRQVVSAGSGVSRAFLKAQSVLFGGYKDALQNHKGGEVSFSNDLFLDHKSASMRGFLQSAIHLQFFKQFIDGRLDILNTGKVPQDLFEEEILRSETTGRYIQCAVVVFVRQAFSQTQTLQRGGSLSHRAQSDCLQNRLPITQHFGMVIIPQKCNTTSTPVNGKPFDHLFKIFFCRSCKSRLLVFNFKTIQCTCRLTLAHSIELCVWTKGEEGQYSRLADIYIYIYIYITLCWLLASSIKNT
uniref:DENN domain containing 1C n=1 Tax=Hippocampus comes TaxID=109280 RepID=A0A3Q2YFW3_HIPCM